LLRNLSFNSRDEIYFPDSMRFRIKTVIYTYITILCFVLLLHIIIEIFKVSLGFTLQNSDIIKI